MRLEVLHSGPICALFDRDSGFLRQIRFGSTEILRGIYAAVRDRNWNTIPIRMSDLCIETASEHIEITFSARHRHGPIDFSWNGRIEIASTGRIRYILDGEALSDFQKNRIGFCILHPPSCAGLPATIEEVKGNRRDAAFPSEISPHQPFLNLRSIRHRPTTDLEVTVRMEGEVFEMEDQRNWTDASFKTYCTPLALPFPEPITAGTRIRQVVTIEVDDSGLHSPSAIESGSPIRLVANRSTTPTRLPPIGLACDRRAPRPLSDAAILKLHDLHLAHLRVDLFTAESGWEKNWILAAGQARALGTTVEVALHLGEDPATELEAFHRLQQATDPSPEISRIIVYSTVSITTPDSVMALAREKLSPHLPHAELGGGTDAYFAEINRTRPKAGTMDFVAFSINPQVHAFDDLSIIETLPMQGLVVRNAAVFTGRPIVVSPVSLRPRFNPNATGPEPEPAPGTLPASVDSRQGNALGAAWTVGSIKHLAEAGVHAITLFETVGGRGLIADASIAGVSPDWPRDPDEPLPPFAVLRQLTGWCGATIVPVVSSEPLLVEALMLQAKNRACLLITNYSDQIQSVAVENPDQPVGSSWDVNSIHGTGPANEPTRLTGPRPGVLIKLNPHEVLSLTTGAASPPP